MTPLQAIALDKKAMKRTGKLTVHDIGRLAGVSGMTVSRVLNMPDQVSSETLERVREVVLRVGVQVEHAGHRGSEGSLTRS